MSGNTNQDWKTALREACKAGSQAAVARRLGVSAALVNQLLKGSYKGDLERIQGLVEGVLLNAQVHCPAIGEIGKHQCLEYQSQKFSQCVNPVRVRVYRACRSGCPHSKIQET